jgi:hypothetical protein
MAKQPAIKIYGLDKAIDAMQELEPNYRREARKVLMKTPQAVADKARGEARSQPLSGWGSWRSSKDGRDLSWSGKSAAGGIRAVSGGSKLNVRLVSKDPAASIFETIGTGKFVGRANPARKAQGQAFVNAINKRYPKQPRLLRRIWKEERGITNFASDLNKVVEKVSADAQRKVGR